MKTMEAKVTAWTLIIFTIIMLLISVSCTAEDDVFSNSPELWADLQEELSEGVPSRVTNPSETMLSSAETDSLIAEAYLITPEQVTMVNKLLNWSLQTELLYIDLLLFDEQLVNNIESPNHQYCLECKMKALKFCYLHPLWGDTIGELSDADELIEQLEKDDEFTRMWNNINLKGCEEIYKKSL